MATLEMRMLKRSPRVPTTLIANASRWMRAPQSGILRSVVAIGARVAEGDTLAYINNPMGEHLGEVVSTLDGVVIGKSNLPLVFAGEAVFNIAAYEKPHKVSDHIEAYHEQLLPAGDPQEGEEPPLI
jgi:predicted deacylase